VASNDGSAIGAMQALQEAGLQVPRDIAVIGFDDQPDAAAQVPALTTVHVPLAVIGEQALVAMLEHLTRQVPLETIQIPTRLVRRRSCGCIPQAVSSVIDGKAQSGSAASGRSETIDPDNIQAQKEQLVTKMLAVLPSELRYPSQDQHHLSCSILVNALCRSLEENDPAPFQAAIGEFLDGLEKTNASVPWQEMVSVLRREVKYLPFDWEQAGTYGLAEDLLHQTRVAISESAERDDQRHQYQRGIAAKALGELTARLSATLDEHEAVKLLEEHLAEIGIRHIRVILFEPGENDPVAWSLLLNTEADATGDRRFASRDFPPDGLYPRDELLNVALLPLGFQDEALGYVAFDTGELESCSVIATQLSATIKASRLHAQVTELSLTDALTGLFNRRYFDFFLGAEVSRQQRFARGLAIVFMDIDNFKKYNDTYGHPAGDEALQQVAKCLSQGRRSSDMVARIGGDEFVIILPETDAKGARDVVQRIRASIADLPRLRSAISVSFGIAVPCGKQTNADLLVSQADLALYKAKRTGRNRTVVFEEVKTGGEDTGP
jgi:diguanylate cyclase (GGDEF)-like protein